MCEAHRTFLDTDLFTCWRLFLAVGLCYHMFGRVSIQNLSKGYQKQAISDEDVMHRIFCLTGIRRCKIMKATF